jgi:hypothetical protein
VVSGKPCPLTSMLPPSPGAVGLALEIFHGVEVGAHLLENAVRPGLERRALDQDADALHGGKLTDDLAEHPGDRRETAGPVRAVVRPDPESRQVVAAGLTASELLSYC